MTTSPSAQFSLAQKLAHHFSAFPQVEAIALGGSHASGASDTASDIDLYVYTNAEIPLIDRQGIIEACGGATKADLDMTHWGPGDEWFDASTGIEVDIVYFGRQWMDDQIKRVWVEHRASLGYTTCFCHTVRNSHIFHDPSGWFQSLQALCREDYPESLRDNIIALNHSVLRNVIPSYLNQLKKALQRQDLVSVNHRLAGLLASYFDVIFAVNCMLHPGEKRLIALATTRCKKLPMEMDSDIEAVVRASASSTDQLIANATRLLDRLDDLLTQEGFDTSTSRPKSPN